MGKVKLTLSIEEEVVEKAKDMGLNLSKVCENALIDIIKRIERPLSQNSGVNYPKTGQKGNVLVLRPGFEPGSRAREARMLGRTTLPELPVDRNSA